MHTPPRSNRGLISSGRSRRRRERDCQRKIELSAENAAMGANSGNIGQAIADPRWQVSNHDRKLPCGQPIDTVLDPGVRLS
jgi:hypothetical protein